MRTEAASTAVFFFVLLCMVVARYDDSADFFLNRYCACLGPSGVRGPSIYIYYYFYLFFYEQTSYQHKRTPARRKFATFAAQNASRRICKQQTAASATVYVFPGKEGHQPGSGAARRRFKTT